MRAQMWCLVVVVGAGCKERPSPTPPPPPVATAGVRVPVAPPPQPALPSRADAERVREEVEELAKRVEPHKRRKLPRRPVVPVELSADMRAYIDAVDRFVELAPEDEDTPGLRFIAANLLVRSGHIADAIPRFETVIRTHPEHEVAQYSANLLLDALARSDNHTELCRWATAFHADATLLADKPDLTATVTRLMELCTAR